MRTKMKKRELERTAEQRRLDAELRPYRKAALEENPTNGLLRAIRKALRVPVAEIAEKVEVGRSTLFDFERRELDGSMTLRSMSRIAEAMDCKLVYGIVPKHGKTLEALAEERMWRAVLGGGDPGNEGTRSLTA